MRRTPALDGQPAGNEVTPMIRFEPMTEPEFQAYLAESVPRYAGEHVRAGDWHPAEALEKSRSEHQQLLPDGRATKNNFLWSLIDSETGSRVGILWLAVYPDRPQPSAFLFDFEIFEEFRGQGNGTRTLQALEEKARALGVDAISLHVFSHNTIAQSLYRKSGYETTGFHMTKLVRAAR
jgi:ribosomal protein S18 acetylase RimI-like enzyme